MAIPENIGKLSLGTYKLTPEEAVQACRMAYSVGITHFDTAALYKTEEAVGTFARAAAATRPHLTTKVHPRHHGTVRATACIARSCAALPHIDVLMLHRPNGWGISDEDQARVLRETWSAMEKAVDDGKVVALGVSNVSASQLEDLLTWARIRPIVLQVEFHPLGRPSTDLLAVAARAEIRVQAYSPFGGEDGKRVLENADIMRIADNAAVTPAQAVLCWLIHHWKVDVAFRATRPEYVREAISAACGSVFLTTEQYEALDALNVGLITCGKRCRD